jgi:hypothetical protein
VEVARSSSRTCFGGLALQVPQLVDAAILSARLRKRWVRNHRG